MTYNYKLQSDLVRKFNKMKNNVGIFYYTIKLNNYTCIKSFRFHVKKVLRDIRNQNMITNKEMKYIGVFETSSQLTKTNRLFEENIIDIGLHIHLFVSVPRWFTYETIRFPLVNRIDNHIMKRNSKVSMWIGDEKTDFDDIDRFVLYHTKQFQDTRSKEFILSNLK